MRIKQWLPGLRTGVSRKWFFILLLSWFLLGRFLVIISNWWPSAYHLAATVVAWSFLWLVPLIGLRLKNAGMHVGVIVGLLVGSVWLGVVVILRTQSVLSLNFSGTPTFSLTWAGYLLSFIIFLVLPTGYLKAGVSAWKIMFGVVGSGVISTMFFAATLQGVVYARNAVGGSETSARTANLLTQKLNHAVDGDYQFLGRHLQS